jgi:hypothetical protein
MAFGSTCAEWAVRRSVAICLRPTVKLVVPADLHINSATSGHHGGVLDGSAHDHDGVMQRALCFINELLRASTQHHGSGLGLWAALEEVEALSTNLCSSHILRSNTQAGFLWDSVLRAAAQQHSGLCAPSTDLEQGGALSSTCASPFSNFLNFSFAVVQVCTMHTSPCQHTQCF